MLAPSVNDPRGPPHALFRLGFGLIEPGTKGPFCVSPLSIGLVLGIIAGGADDEGFEKYCQLLQTSHERFVTDFQRLMSLLGDTGKLSGANAVLCDEGFVLAPEFVTHAMAMGATVETSFAKLVDATDAINRFVSDHTKGRINPIVDRSDLIGMNLAFVNALAFDDKWLVPFSGSDTIRAYTFRNGISTSTVDMMFRKDISAEVFAGEGYTAVSVPFETGRRFVAWLPDDNGTLEKTLPTIIRDGVPSFTYSRLSSLPSFRRERLARFGLPKVNFRSSKELSGSLAALGFPLSAFPKMGISVTWEPLVMGQILHRTQIEWDEVRAQGAAATVSIGFGSAARSQTREIILDRPFAFAIVADCGTPVFTGIFTT